MTKWLNKRGLSWTNDGASTQREKYAAINYQAPEDDLLVRGVGGGSWPQSVCIILRLKEI